MTVRIGYVPASAPVESVSIELGSRIGTVGLVIVPFLDAQSDRFVIRCRLSNIDGDDTIREVVVHAAELRQFIEGLQAMVDG